VNRSESIQYRQLLFLFVVFGLMSGCSLKTTAVAPTPAAGTLSPIAVESKDGFQWPDNDLPGRFQQYWTLRKAGDAVGSFEYEAPHVREMVIWGKYQGLCQHVRNDWLSIRVEKINIITEQLIEVDFNMVAKNKEKNGAKREIFFRDSWLLFSGQWFHVLKDPFVTGDGFGK
jgi:hypothetical protein